LYQIIVPLSQVQGNIRQVDWIFYLLYNISVIFSIIKEGNLQMKDNGKSFAGMFSNLHDEFGPVPWWCWTGKMTKKEILSQLRDMKEKGINEFFIMAMYGLEFPSFLKDTYWDYIGFVLEKSKEAGMKVWLYDDLNWPSGTAAGYLLKEHPEYLSSAMELNERKVANGKTVNIEAMLEGGSEILYAGFRNLEGNIRDIPVEKARWWEKQGERKWVNRTGRPVTFMMLVKKPCCRVLLSSTGTADSWQQHGYGDMLDKKAVETWMSYIHVQYLKRFRRYFGSTLKGFFFDEPYANINKNMSFAYTKTLFSEFEKRCGYRLEDNFRLLLSENSRPETLKARIDYYGLITDLFSKNFSETAGRWCSKNRVSVTGHCMAEESISFSNKVNGDIHEFIKHIQVPGMDMLAGCMPGKPLETAIGKEPYDYPLLTFTAKRISSTARYTGAKRTMCEAFGVRDWNCTLEEQKKDNDWLASMGISLINDNALIYSIADFRKRAISGKHFSQPWWKYYRIYADYCRRVSLFASFAPLDTDIAVLYSVTSAHAGTTFRVGTECEFWNETPQSHIMLYMLVLSMNSLFENHVDFEMLFEDVLKESSVSGGVLKCRNAEFRTVVVPGCHVIDGTCALKLKKFSESGGRILWLGCKPQWSYDKGKLSPCRKEQRGVFIPFEKDYDREKFKAEFISRILPLVTKKWDLESRREAEGIWATARKTNDEYMLFLANHTGRDREITLNHGIEGTAVIMDVDDGRVYRPETVESGGTSRINVGLRDGQSLIVNIGRDFRNTDIKQAGCPAASDFSGRKIMLDKNWDFSLKGANHYLPELFVKTDPLMKGEKERWHEKPLDKTWIKTFHGRLADGFTSEESAFYWVKGCFNLSFIPEKLSFIVDTREWQKLFINGREVPEPKGYCLWDRENMIFTARDFYRKGTNEFVFLVKSSYWRSWKKDLPGFNQKGFIEPVVISGDFMVEKRENCTMLAPCAGKMENNGWNTAGYPHFAGTGIYRQTIKLKKVPKSPRLVIESAFTAVEVKINGKKAGTKAWKPYIFNIEGLIKTGKNEIEISVTNGLGNILRRVYSGPLGNEKTGGITGPVYILFSE